MKEQILAEFREKFSPKFNESLGLVHSIEPLLEAELESFLTQALERVEAEAYELGIHYGILLKEDN